MGVIHLGKLPKRYPSFYIHRLGVKLTGSFGRNYNKKKKAFLMFLELFHKINCTNIMIIQ